MKDKNISVLQTLSWAVFIGLNCNRRLLYRDGLWQGHWLKALLLDLVGMSMCVLVGEFW